MAKIVKSMSLDVSKRNRIQAVVAKQYDRDSRFLRIQFTDEGVPIQVEPTSVIMINASRADNASKAFVGEVNEDGTVTVPITYWMLELDDRVSCDVSVVDIHGSKLSTLNFTIEVEHSNYSGEEISEDDPEYDLLVQVLVNEEKRQVQFNEMVDHINSLEQGKQGPSGEDGKSAYQYAQEGGYTGTESEFAEDINPDNIKADAESFISTELAKRGQLKPEFANDISECTDTTKLYVLPDGYIYGYMLTEKEVTIESTKGVLADAIMGTDQATGWVEGEGYTANARLSGSGGNVVTGYTGVAGVCVSGYIPVSIGDVVRIKNFYGPNGVGTYVISYGSGKTKLANKAWGITDAPNYTWNTGDWYTVEGEKKPTGVTTFTVTEANFGAGVAYIRISGVFNYNGEKTIITVNEEIIEGGIEIVTEYAWANTGHAFVSNGTTLMYISPDGLDSNDGLTADTPKKTVRACVLAGATRISAKRGIYKQNVFLTNIGKLEIFPTDNDYTYSVGNEKRQPIVFDLSDTINVSSFENYNSIKRAAYSNSANTQIDKVFIKQNLPPVVGDGYGSRYNATVWLFSEDEKTVCIKLKPVLTLTECEAETGTFTYVDGYVYINSDFANVTKIIVPTYWETGFYISGAEKVVLKEVEVRFSGTYNIDIRNCTWFDFVKCACKYTSYGSGFHPYNSNGIMKSCYATKNFDGYGISGYGHTTYVDCVAEYNFDDGMSHHDGSEGTVIGGRYEGNGKGGNTPAYGAKVNIYGGIYKGNAGFGIGYLWASGLTPASGLVQGAVMVDNPKGLVVNTNCNVVTIDCNYIDNIIDKDIHGNVTNTDATDITEWDAPIYDANIPVFELSAEKAAMTNAACTPDDIYAKYDALMAKYPHYITKTDLGLCSDGVNHVYRYDFCEPDSRHTSGYPWSETKTKAIIVSGIHYEWAGIYGLYYALEEIAENPELFSFRRNTHIVVVPCMNPYATIAENYSNSVGVKNANGVEIHRNFEVGWVLTEAGTTHYGGAEPLSEVETQYVDNIMKENTDAALFLTCHNFGDTSFSFIWPSVATPYMCNMGYRLIDKLSNVWIAKYSDELVGLEDYRTTDIPSWDNRLGFAHISQTPGTETRQGTKYGIQSANVEINGRFWVHGTTANPEPAMSSFTMSRGTEVYVNFLLTVLGCYDYKDKELYSR